MADNVPALFCYVDAAEVYRHVNRRCEELFRLSATDIIGKRMEEILGPQFYASARPHIGTVLSGREVHYEIATEIAGSAYVFQITYMPDFDENGSVKGFFSLVSDFTERRQPRKGYASSPR